MLRFFKNLMEVSSCLSISWDVDWYVSGIVFSKAGKKLKIIDHALCRDASKSFPERLRKVYEELKGDEQDRVLLGGYLPNSFTILFNTPALKFSEVDKFLSYELPRHLPCNIEDLTWAFRPISFAPQIGNKTERIKVIAIATSVFQKLSDDIIASKIKFDALLHPYFVTEPLFTGTNLFLDSVNDLFYSNSSDELQGWYMSPVPKEKGDVDKLVEEREFLFGMYREYIQEDFDYYTPCIVLAEYGLSQNFNVDKKFGLKIPSICKPKRFRGLKLGTLFLLLGFFIIFGSYTVRDTINNYEILTELKSQKDKLVSEDVLLNKKIVEGKKIDTVVQQIFSMTPDSIEVLDFIEYLSETVPGDIWLNYLNVYGNSANLTFQTGGSSDKMISDFYKSKNYILQNSRKNKSADNIEYIYANFVKRQKGSQNIEGEF